MPDSSAEEGTRIDEDVKSLFDPGESRPVRRMVERGHSEIEKTFVQVHIGTTVIEVPKRIHNPITERTEDLTNLSDDGYLKHFLALLSHSTRPDVIDIESAPYLAFDLDRWELEELDGTAVLKKREPEGELDKKVLGDSQ